MAEIRWLEEAINDLEEIFLCISQDSKNHAEKEVRKIVKRTQVLKSLIKAGKIVEEANNPKVRELISGNYRIIYPIVDDKTIHIILVHHSSRDLKIRLKS